MRENPIRSRFFAQRECNDDAISTTAADFRCQIDRRSRHTATQPDRTGGFLAPAKQGWRGVAADFVPQRDSDGLAVTCVGSAPFLPIAICRCQDRRSNVRPSFAAHWSPKLPPPKKESTPNGAR